MKPALSRQQAVWLGSGVMVLGGAILLAWFGLSGLGEKQTEAQALADRMGDPALGALLSDGAGVEKVTRDISEVQKLEEELKNEVGKSPNRWAAATREATGEGKVWAQDPGKWKDQLISVVSELQKASPEARLKMSPDFYLGLDGFRQKSPSVSEVPALALHLAVARRLVEKLFEARKAREQYATACEIKSLAGPGSILEKSSESGPSTPVAQPAVSASGPERKTFRMEIQCSPEVLYEFVRLLSSDDWLFLVDDISIVNQKQEFPPRSEIAKRFLSTESSAQTSEKESKPAGKKLLEILAGDESVLAQLEIEFVSWKNPQEVASAKPEKKP